MKILSSLTFTLLSLGLGLQATAHDIYCVQVSPTTEYGYILEEAQISKSASDPRILIKNFGIGIRSENGDGTVSRTLLSLSNPLAASRNPEHQSKSAQWRNTFAFELPLPQAQGTAILYLPRGIFGSSAGGEFSSRIKVTAGGKERNFTMFCNFQ